MIAELQISSSRLIATIRENLADRLSRIVIYPTTRPTGEELWVERLQIVGTPTIQSRRGSIKKVYVKSEYWDENLATVEIFDQTVQITIDLMARLVTRSQALFKLVEAKTFAVLFEITSRIEGQAVRLDFMVVRGMLSPPALEEQLSAALNSATRPIYIPFSAFLLSYTDYTNPRQEHPVNSGLALSADKSFIGVRLETVPFPRMAQPWIDFFEGRNANRLSRTGAGGFVPAASRSSVCLFVQSGAFTDTLQLAIEAKLRESTVFDFTPGVGVDWLAVDGHARIVISFTGQKTIDVLDNDLVSYTHVRIVMNLSVPFINRIGVDLDFDIDGEIAGISIPDLITVIAEHVIAVIAASAVTKELEDNSTLGMLITNAQCSVSGVSMLQCEGAAVLSSTNVVAGDLRDALALPDGIILMGEGKLAPELTDPEAEVLVSEFVWRPPYVDCNSLQHIVERIKQGALVELLEAHAFAGVHRISGTRPLRLNAFQVLDDPQNRYRFSVTAGPEFYVNYADTKHPEPSYPLIVALYTNAGVKLARIDPPPSIDLALMKTMLDEEVRRATHFCPKLKAPWGSTLLNPEWLVDPAPRSDLNEYVQLWEFEVPPTVAGGTVELLAKSSKQKVQLTARQNQMLSASVMTKRGEGLELQLKEGSSSNSPRSLTHGPKPTSDDRSLEITQTLLCKSGEILLEPSPLGVALLSGGAGAVLAIASNSILRLFDVRTRVTPDELPAVFLKGLNGVMMAPAGQILAWGEFGLLSLKRQGASLLKQQILTSAVDSVAFMGEQCFVSTCENVIILSCDYQEKQRFPRPGSGSGSLCNLSNKLLWISKEIGLQFSNCGWRPFNLGEAVFPHAFEVVQLGRSQYLFVPNDISGGSLWTLDSRGVAMITRYAADPWFYKSARLPTMIVTVNRQGVLEIFDVVARQKL